MNANSTWKLMRRTSGFALAFFLVAEWWAGVTLIILNYDMGIRTTWPNGDPLSLPALWLLQAVGASPFLLGAFAALWVGACVMRHSPPWRVWVLSLLYLGTPTAIISATWIRDYILPRIGYGQLWEEMLPPALGLITSCVLASGGASLWTRWSYRRYRISGLDH